MVKLIHDLGFTTNTAKVPGMGYYTIIIDLAEKIERSSKFSIDLVKKLSFTITSLLATKKINTEEQWMGDIYLYQIQESEPLRYILYTMVLNTQTMVLTITCYDS